ncbi:uncharacterized protein LOC123559689 [Mercenaria mercenaria]|uniref:uncharacterized protein LOC123559689 n=1 Tax=Mercenaria mercenaria TaxID=6596 RepID=UPI00234EFFAF|nr:uncharacterized protein LOC123559689 [Mercenaria mercenaria]
MGSEYDYDILGSLLGANSSSQDLAGLFDTDPNPDATNPYGTGGNLQLAPLYSNPRHQQERDNIGDFLNLGRSGFPPHDNYYEDDYEENLETQSHMSYDANGMHVGVSMSRSHQTPFGTARTNVGMQMSIGPGGMMIRSRSSSSLGGGGHGGLLMAASFGRSPRHSAFGQSMFEPVGSMLSPLGGLFSPLGGLFSPMIGSYNPEHEPSLFGFQRPQRTSSRNQGMTHGSDGPIIEEVFDEEENGYSSSNLAVEYKEEEIDPSLGLGLLPDVETAYSGKNQNRNEQEESESESVSVSNEILNEFAYTEATSTEHRSSPVSVDGHSGDNLTNENQTQSRTITLLTDSEEDKHATEQKGNEENRLSDSIDTNAPDYSISQGLSNMNKCEQPNNRKEDVPSKPKERAKFTKQTFRNTPFKLNKDHDTLPFLRSPPDEGTSFNTGQSGSVSTQKLKVNKNKQMNKSKIGTVNKNSTVRRRTDSSCSSSSEQGWTGEHNFPEPSEEINCIPIPQLLSEEHSDDNRKTPMEKETASKKRECTQGADVHSAGDNRVPATKTHLYEDSNDRYESLQDTQEDSMHAEGQTSHNEYIRMDESLQESRDFTLVTENAAKTSSEIVDITSKVDTDCGNITHGNGYTSETPESVLFDNPNTDNTSTADRDSPTILIQEGFVSDPDSKSSSVEQTVPYGHNLLHSVIVDDQDNIEGQRHDEQTDTTGGELGNESNAEVFERSSSPQDFSTHESNVNPYTQEASYEDIKEERRNKSRLGSEQSDDSSDIEVGQHMTSSNATTNTTDTNGFKSVEPNRGTQGTLAKSDSFKLTIFFYSGKPDQNSDRQITTFMSKEERKNEAGNMFQVKQSEHEVQTETTDDRRPQQNSFQTKANFQKKFHAQKDDTQYHNRENQKFENPSGKLREQRTNIETSKAPIYSQEEDPTSPVLETFQFDTAERCKPSETSRHNFQQDPARSETNRHDFQQDLSRSETSEHYFQQDSARDACEKTASTSISYQKHNILRQSNQRQQNTNDGRTSPNDDLFTVKQWQLPLSHHVSHHQDTVHRSHSNHRESIARSGRHHNHQRCENCQAHCPHGRIHSLDGTCIHNHKYVCHDCGKRFTPEEYAKLKTDHDDIFEHPDWQYLNEYRDGNGQFTDPKQRRNKAKVNKNMTAKIKSTAAFPKQESRASGNHFGDLVESVGLTMKDVYPDGNCLFTSICDQLRIRGDFSYTPRDLRHAAVDYLREHPNQDDGTPLLAFLADEERNWDKYLSSMRREGHWGDHFVIWALAHVLDRRFVIYRGDTELQKTVVEPSGPMTEDSFEDITDRADNNGATGDREDSDSKDADADTQRDQNQTLTPVQKEEMYLGHISQSHYVSLRPHGWRDRLFEALKNKQTSSLIGCNPESSSLDSNGGVSVPREVLSFSSTDLNYFLNYLWRGGFLIKFGLADRPTSSNDPCSTNRLVGNMFNFQYKMLSNIKKESIPTGRNFYYLSTPRDTTVVENQRQGNVKDLVLHKENFKVGQFKLIPVTPSIWKPTLMLINGLSFLKHIEFKRSKKRPEAIILGFKCASWPEEAIEWKSRKRTHDWPSQNTIDEIIATGVLAIPAKGKVVHDRGSGNNEFPFATKTRENIEHESKERFGESVSVLEEYDIIWEYSFDLSKSILCQRDLNREAEMLHCVLAVFTRFAFEDKMSITDDHLRTLTFFTCEAFSSEEILHQPGKCLVYALDQLKEYLQRKHFPHYFMRGRNLIADMEYDDIVWHVERLHVLKTNPMVILYCVLDYCALQNMYDVGKVFDGLSEVANSKRRGREVPDTYLVTLCVTALTNMAKLKTFWGIERTIDLWYGELAYTYGRERISEDQFIRQLLTELPPQEEWLLALYLDSIQGSKYVQFVCKGRAYIQLGNFFGNEVAPILFEETSLGCEEIHLPTALLGDSTTNLAIRLGEVIRYDIGSTNAYRSAVHHFLKANTHDLLLSVEKDKRDNKDYNSHLKLSNLMILFNQLHNTYQEQGDIYRFRDLMELFDELCNFTATERDFTFLAELWTLYREDDRAREAQMKAVSVRDDVNMMSTAL